MAIAVRHREATPAIEVTHATHRRDRQKAGEYARALVPGVLMVDLAAREIVVHGLPVDGSHTEVVRHGDGVIDLPGAAPPDVGTVL